MSAFFRTKYPNIAVGAVASSGPVQAVLDFAAYQVDKLQALNSMIDVLIVFW